MIYSYYDYEINTQQLVKYNIVTKQKLVLANYGIYNQPKWNENGWITFSNMHHVHVIKEDGSDYKQITSEPMNTHPFWNGDDLYWWFYGNGLPFIEYRQNINQVFVDTCGVGFAIKNSDILGDRLLTWIKDTVSNVFLYGYLDLANRDQFSISDFTAIKESLPSITGLAWDPSGEFFYSTIGYQGNNGNGGLYKITLTGQEEKIMDFCQSKQYSNISSSADGKYLIGERTACSLVEIESWPGAGRIVQNSTVWLINTETMEETRINID